MKKLFKACLLIFSLGLLFSACDINDLDTEDPDEKKVEENITETSKEAEDTSPKTNLKTDSKEEVEGDSVETVYPPLVRIKGKTYKSLGMVNSMVTCGTADGKIEKSISPTEAPREDDQSNFGEGYGYQFWDDGLISLSIDNRWILFQDIEKTDPGIPDCVAHFTGEITYTDDSTLVINVDTLPEEFSWSFDYLSLDEIKPISVPVDNLITDFDIDSTSLYELKGRKIKVYFDGEVENLEAEISSLAFLGEVYRIELVD